MKTIKLKTCTKCHGTHTSRWKMCDECRRKHRDYQTVRREERREAGTCGQCGRVPESGATYCSACLAYFRNYFSLPGNHEKNLGAQKRTRIRWKEQGRCARCGLNPPAENRVSCEECLEYAKEYRDAKSG